MSKYMDRSKELRAIVTPHYNCAQSVLLPFAPDAGLSEEAAYQVAANFGGGMKIGSVCGAITGGLMALGLFGMDDPQTVADYFRRLRQNHEGHIDCAPLLKLNAEKGLPKKPHCDDMVYECVALVEDILRAASKL